MPQKLPRVMLYVRRSGATLPGEARAIRLKRETTSAEVEEPLPLARETAERSRLKARTEAGLAIGSNSSNSLTASSRPRVPDLKRPAMTR
jgi:hypothetical protein